MLAVLLTSLDYIAEYIFGTIYSESQWIFFKIVSEKPHLCPVDGALPSWKTAIRIHSHQDRNVLSQDNGDQSEEILY